MTTALCLGGGGSHGAWAVGAIKALREHGIEFDNIYGTSVGAIMAPLVLLDEIAALEVAFTHIKTSDVIVNYDFLHLFNLLANEALYDSSPIASLLDTMITSERYIAMVASEKSCTITATNMKTGDVEYFSPCNIADGAMPRDKFLRAVLASGSQPVIMPSVQIKPGGDEYCDGGVRVVIPLEKAILDGATTVYGIVLSPEIEPLGEKDYTVPGTLLRTIDLFLREIVRQNVEDAKLLAEDNGATLVILRPAKSFETDGLTFDPAFMRRWLDDGHATTKAKLAKDGRA